jgi:hypothetical protein
MKQYNLVHESIYLTSAYQLPSFANIIGTLLKVSDQSSMDMGRITYESMRDVGMSDESMSWGLYKASRELRDECFQGAGTGEKFLYTKKFNLE